MNGKTIIAALLGACVMLAVVWFGWSAGWVDVAMTEQDQPGGMAADAGDETTRKVAYWVAPMDPNFRQEKPGKSPMGMDLIPVYTDQINQGASISIHPQIAQNLGVRTAKASVGDFHRTVHAVGYTQWDEASFEMLHPRAAGWIEKFWLKSVGDTVKRGEVLYELFAPLLVSAQREYVTAIRSNNRALIDAAEDRMSALGFTRQQISALRKSRKVSGRLKVQSDRDAVVTHIGVREGNYIKPETNIATLASLKTIWLDVDVFEADSIWMREGLAASVQFAGYPGDVWHSQVAYVYPELDPKTRSLRLRMVMDNRDGRLRPNMFSKVTIQAEPRVDVLSVPREAVIHSGNGARVVVALGDGRFAVNAVKTGVVNQERVEILQGLKAGDDVVISGQFLLDAEANGEEALQRLDSSMDMMMKDSDSQPAQKQAIFATGTVVERTGENTLMINHAPILALEWPAMTMQFRAAPGVSIDHVNSNDRVEFLLEPEADGSYCISELHKTGDAR
ncbi:Cation efflux system protein CusB [BD1-7 clade bacterium]|uniref:Cation efflux system protein CusB n=1 Tax=BD1-7 clade bacterium TaxID=2029982 RepID=A0A5S9PNL4_9GAMM|nr:Cation efflux system protein CusB [BD1-7 clade bacterium]CAA0106023.1 Cation efflux system protein CusB [BD1-7 clade bacterium]